MVKWTNGIHPGRLTWNLRIHPWKRKIIFQTISFRFYVNLRGCKWSSLFTTRRILGSCSFTSTSSCQGGCFFLAHRPTAQPPAGAKTTQLHGPWLECLVKEGVWLGVSRMIPVPRCLPITKMTLSFLRCISIRSVHKWQSSSWRIILRFPVPSFRYSEQSQTWNLKTLKISICKIPWISFCIFEFSKSKRALKGPINVYQWHLRGGKLNRPATPWWAKKCASCIACSPQVPTMPVQ